MMKSERFISGIAKEQNLSENQIQTVASLLSEGATIPFISRYRKEATGSLDEVAVKTIRDRLNQLDELEERKETIFKSLEKHGHMTDELWEKVLAAESMAVLEDIYLPYKPKRRTRAIIAKGKGLEPLALMIFEQKGANPVKEAESFIDILPDEEEATAMLENLFVSGEGDDSAQVKLAVKDCYKRLLSRSMETETRLHAKEKADIEAIKVFADNLRQLLLAPPLGAKRVMGIDPGFRTGCKLVCLDPQGKLLHYDTVYPHMSEKKTLAEAEKIKSLFEEFDIEVIAIGNGTAGRETEAFVKAVPFSKPVQIIMVNESGASIYSASEAAREEFPDHDLTVRGAVSIGRRLMDPLAELVKIDPKSIGVGQYQHDVDQNALKQTLDDVVMSCVNGVGVHLNRASAKLLTYVSGLNAGIAKNIVAYREENGPFISKQQLTKVPRLGPKAFEQSAGFLRILGGENPLDASAVHPESYHIVDAMAKDLETTVVDIIKKPDIRHQIDITKYVTDSVGIPTLNDILDELAKPGRDPREKFEVFAFADGIEKIEDLKPGMKIPGIVTNITAFGAFVDIGVHQDGLVHISQMADRYVKNPADIVKVQQKVMVSVLNVDLARNRISLTMKSQADKSGTVIEKQGFKKAKNRNPKPKKKTNLSSANIPFNNPLAEALIKSGLK
ncbi:MAG: Tex family protein [Spirochaetales bacterium]|jgi:uncharacterized protein|nr:Tex family protein [Spirochaetales bacterium]